MQSLPYTEHHPKLTVVVCQFLVERVRTPLVIQMPDLPIEHHQ